MDAPDDVAEELDSEDDVGRRLRYSDQVVRAIPPGISAALHQKKPRVCRRGANRLAQFVEQGFVDRALNAQSQQMEANRGREEIPNGAAIEWWASGSLTPC